MLVVGIFSEIEEEKVNFKTYLKNEERNKKL